MSHLKFVFYCGTCTFSSCTVCTVIIIIEGRPTGTSIDERVWQFDASARHKSQASLSFVSLSELLNHVWLQ